VNKALHNLHLIRALVDKLPVCNTCCSRRCLVSFPVGSTSSSWNPTRSISADAYWNHFTLQAYWCAPAPARQRAVRSLAISPPIVSLAQRYSCYRNVKLSGVMDELRAKNGRGGVPLSLVTRVGLCVCARANICMAYHFFRCYKIKIQNVII